MTITTLIIKTNPLSTSDILIPDMGYPIPQAGGQVTLTERSEIDFALSSEDLRILSQDGAFPLNAPGNINSIILNDGVADIPPGAVDDFADGSGNVEILVLEFDFADGTPLTPFLPTGSLKVGDIIINSEIEIETDYDDLAAQIRLGTSTVVDLLFDIGDLDPNTIGTYGNGSNTKLVANDTLRLTHVPGTSTQGKGRAVVTVRRG